MLGKRQVTAIVGQELRQEPIALARGHPSIKHQVRKHCGVRQHAGEIRVGDGKFLRDNAAGETVGTGPAVIFRQGKRAQPHLRSLI
jgi:hypothetical protein